MSKPKATLDSLRADPRNPRRITKERLAKLKKAMQKYGDLGGIILTRTSPDDPGHLVGGHQRIEAFRDAKDAQVVVEKHYEKPTKAGTTAEGYVLINGERFAYRETLWSKSVAQGAMLSANKNAGDFDVTGLTAIINELNDASYDLELTMFDDQELQAYLPDERDLAAATTFDLSGEAPLEDAPESADDKPTIGTVSAQPQGVPSNHVKMVQLFYKEEDHQKFVELTDALKDIYKQSNLSDTVMEAIKRASITAALK